MDESQVAYLDNLCKIFNIPESSTQPNPELALRVLSAMFLVPTIEDHSDRNRALNEIRANLAGQFDNYSVFTGRTASLAVQMQEFPYWFNHLNESTDTLVRQYKNIEFGTGILGAIVVGSGVGAGVAGATEWSKSGSVRTGAKKTAERLAGRSAAVEELQRRIGARISPRAAGIAGAAVMVGGTLAYYGGLERMEEIRAVLMHRFQNGEMSDDQFRDVFGKSIDPDDIQRYWEM